MAKKNRTFSFGGEHWDRLTALSVKFFKREDQRTLVLEKLIDQAFERNDSNARAIEGEARPNPPPAGEQQDTKAKDAITGYPERYASGVDPNASLTRTEREAKIEAAQRRMAQNVGKR